MTIREQFEAWVEISLGLNTQRLVTGDYQSFGVSCAWAAWQASREAVEVELPAPDLSYDNHGQLLSRDSVIAVLEAAGIRVAP